MATTEEGTEVELLTVDTIVDQRGMETKTHERLGKQWLGNGSQGRRCF